MNAIQRFIYFYGRGNSGGGERLPLVFDDETIVFSADQATALPNQSHLWLPQLIWANGKTHYVYQRPETGRLFILSQDASYGVGLPIGFSNQLGPSFNNHHMPTIIGDGDKLYITVESRHNVQTGKILKPRANGDDLIWELAETEVPGAPTYMSPMRQKENGAFVIINQFNDTLAGIQVNRSGDFLGEWSSVAQITTRLSDEDEHYTITAFNGNIRDGRMTIVVSGRNDDVGPPVHFNRYRIQVAISDDEIRFYNGDESFSKAGVITTDELSNFQYYTTGSDVNQGHVPVPALDQTGNFYDVAGDGLGGYVFIYQMIGQSVVIKPVVLPDAPSIVTGSTLLGSGQIGGCVLLMPISASEVYAFFTIDTGDWVKVFRYKTTDLGDTWTNEGDVFADVNQHVASVMVPWNYFEIPNNKNSMIVGIGENTGSNPDPKITRLFIKKIAFGEIQPEVSIYDNILPFSEAEYHALMTRSYIVKTGAIDNEGTACSALLDQSPNGVDSNAVGAPTLDDADNPTYVTLDGTDDAFPLDVEGLSGLTEGTVILVVRGVGSQPYLTISNSGNQTNFIHLRKSSGQFIEVLIDSPNTLVIRGTTVIDDESFHILAWTFQNGQNTSVLQWVDGELQQRNVVVGSNTIEGRFFDYVSGATNIEIGRLVRSNGTSWGNIDIAAIAISSTPLTLEQHLRSFKFLSNVFNIPLNSHFQ